MEYSLFFPLLCVVVFRTSATYPKLDKCCDFFGEGGGKEGYGEGKRQDAFGKSNLRAGGDDGDAPCATFRVHGVTQYVI